ncbi:NAD-dependent epimerase/dehydratase family protein [Nocardia rhizosphaerihabitans]|uniref:UDP-glucose epimerase YtcB n=1 Tax=Nocardia rhizosphaerihabitans TaxID=1691570 RepID=A0ABQ2K572_9NOCA|nr:NAD-dependent epimerase/dehydratase family protein [Nocardia rhizosphaerihabitans]GGN65851.1 putative UDP-glucose epimerase YtcB [Nocardia rhizosphaerihabitans]
MTAPLINQGPVVVTGAAGFIGSHLVDGLLARGTEVIAIDRRSVHNDPVAARNLADALADPSLALHQADLATDELDELITGARTVFHLAAVPGVRDSWAERFPDYASSNVVATQRLLAACERAQVPRLVLASSSSVYGQTSGPSAEGDPTYPMSPYGATKLAAEHLCMAHAARPDTGTSVVALRYFTVYGPRQRSDMAISRVLAAVLSGVPVPLYGDGHQSREFTYVDDIVAATLAAATIADDIDAEIVNVGGGSSVSMLELIAMIGQITGRKVPLAMEAPRAGDVEATRADLTLAHALLGYSPRVELREGIARQLDWMVKQPPSQSVSTPVAEVVSR